MNLKKNKQNTFLLVLIFACIVIGILVWIPNLIYKRTEIYWIASIPLGIIALLCSGSLRIEKIYKKIICLFLSFILLFSFPILMLIGSTIEAFETYRNNEYSIIIPPANTKPIQVGEITEYISKDNSRPYIIYFGRTTCESCKYFEDALSEAIANTKVSIYYYNTENMPRDESLKVIEQLKLEYVPILVKVSNGKVVDYISENNYEKLTEWIRKET